MKKILTFFLALCVCLNAGSWAVAEPAPEGAPQAVEETSPEPQKDETSGGTESDAPAKESTGGETEGSPESEATTSADEDSDEAATRNESAEPGEGDPTRTGENSGETAPDESDETDGETPSEGGDAETPSQDAGDSPDQTQEGATETPIPENAEAWVELPEGRFGGSLEDVVARLSGGETVYLRANKALKLEKAPVKRLSDVKFKPDEEKFRDGRFEARLSENDPAEAEEYIPVDWSNYEDATEEDVFDALYIWVEDLDQTEPDDPEDPGDPEQPDDPAPEGFAVTAENYAGAAWSREMPVFTLSGMPEDADHWAYAAIIYDERIAILSDNVYAPQDEGVYTVRFALLDAIGDIVEASERYTLWLDATAPEDVTLETVEGQSYALSICASDAMSGVEAWSLDGGETWQPLKDGEPTTYVAEGPAMLEPGMVQVRDAAGNIWVSDAPIALEEYVPYTEPDFGGGGYYGGGGGDNGGGSGKPAKQHAKGEGEKAAQAYDALTLELPEEPMEKLTIGGEEMELALTLQSAQEDKAPLGAARFSAALGAWKRPPEIDDDGDLVEPEPVADTLILTAEPEVDLGDAFTYRWTFNGEVIRLLANSGVKYLALRVGDDVTAFPTEGFTGGAKYTELKMLGVSTRKFDYALDMKVDLDPGHMSATTDCDFSTQCDLEVRVEVENMAYALSASPQSVMYYYDLYLGPIEMMDVPFGEYRPEGWQNGTAGQ